MLKTRSLAVVIMGMLLLQLITCVPNAYASSDSKDPEEDFYITCMNTADIEVSIDDYKDIWNLDEIYLLKGEVANISCQAIPGPVTQDVEIHIDDTYSGTKNCISIDEKEKTITARTEGNARIWLGYTNPVTEMPVIVKYIDIYVIVPSNDRILEYHNLCKGKSFEEKFEICTDYIKNEAAPFIEQCKDMAGSYIKSTASQKDIIDGIKEFFDEEMTFDLDRSGDIASVLKEHEGNSTGYAGLFFGICQAYGIECYICLGEIGAELHAWNYCNIDGQWIYVDATSSCDMFEKLEGHTYKDGDETYKLIYEPEEMDSYLEFLAGDREDVYYSYIEDIWDIMTPGW